MVDASQWDFLKQIDACSTAEEVAALDEAVNNQNLTKIFWESRKTVLTSKDALEKRKAMAKCRYVNNVFASSIPVTKSVNRFAAPHGFKGIAISILAKLGTGCTIFQNVTIGSNTLIDSKNAGFPTIGNNVYIGAGATIIGNVKVGNNVRIGAGCSVTRDVPDNATIVQSKPTIIQKDSVPNNKFITTGDFIKLQASNDRTTPPPSAGSNEQKLIPPSEIMYKRAEGRVLDAATKKKFDEAFRILFCGDLILLEDQVKNAFNGSDYDFAPLFEYTRKYIQAADLSIGVFEGPCGGNILPYSQSNYADGVPLYINFPDSFVDAIKDAGFDLVTTATNHIFDVGDAGLRRTIKVLDAKQLAHVGTYLNAEDKQARRVNIFEKDGIRVASLAYTATVNGKTREYFTEGEGGNVTSILVPKNHSKYDEVVEQVRQDFELAKSHNPDLIIVMPHWGVQFANEPSAFQLSWRQTFLDFGADIVLGDHTHSVQPVKLETIEGKMTYTVFCPGNYANIYRDHNGDAAAMVEIYIDRETKKIIGNSIIPMWVQSPLKGNYRALPIWDIINDPTLGREVSTFDMERVKFIFEHVTRVMLGTELGLNMVQDKLYLGVNGFMRQEAAPLELDDAMKARAFYWLLTTAKGVCFVGDSITEGTRNNGVPWYEPIEYLIDGKVINCGWGSHTTKRLLKNHLEEITLAEADLFVIAVGTNDVRYRNENICAMNADEYVERLKELRDAIVDKHAAAKFVFIAPWTSTTGDKVSKLKRSAKLKMTAEYTAALKKMCAANGDVFIDPTKYISAHYRLFPRSKYMCDAIHPNATEGVRLYAAAVMLS